MSKEKEEGMGVVSHVFQYVGSPGCKGCLSVKLPPCVDRAYWQRHSLLQQEVETLCTLAPTQLVWCAYMFSGMDLPWYAIKPTSGSPFEIAVTSKSMAIKHISSSFSKDGAPVLDMQRSKLVGHSPPIPLHTVDPALFMWATTKVVSHLLPIQLLLPGEEIGLIPATFQLLGKTWMISSLDGEVITCNACEIYEESMTKDLLGNKSLAHAPKVGMLDGVVYVLTEECIFIQSTSPTSLFPSSL
jgi:hypothetical protein